MKTNILIRASALAICTCGTMACAPTNDGGTSRTTSQSVVGGAPAAVTLRAVPQNFPEFVDHVMGTTIAYYEKTEDVSGCETHSYHRENFIYNLISPEPFECPDDIQVEATGGQIEADGFQQSHERLPFLRSFQSDERFICTYREHDFRLELSTADDVACFQRDAPVLVVLMDFADTDMNVRLPNAEDEWSALMFGNSQAQGNHYFNEVFAGRMRLRPAGESQGIVNNGVVRVAVSEPAPTSGKHRIEEQPWVFEALDLADEYVRFEAFDTDQNGRISNDELAVFFVPNLSFLRTEGAGAQANILLNHPVSGVGPVIDKFARTNPYHTSIGVNVHELAHHLFGLKHFVAPTNHGLMGLGTYAEDPVISKVGFPGNHGETRPTHLIGPQRLDARTVEATPFVESGTVTLSSIHTGNYNILALPILDGTLYIENRTREGYDQSIPFCADHEGGLFMTEVLNTKKPLNTVGIGERRDADEFNALDVDFCNHYSLSGHNDSFSYGGYTFGNFSAAGPTMSLTIMKEDVDPVIDNYKFQWWINDPTREDYRMRHYERPVPGQDLILDVENMPEGTGIGVPLAIWLEAFYSTGEVRSKTSEATWSTSSPYLDLRVYSGNGGFVNVYFDAEEVPENEAFIDVEHPSGNYRLRLINIPDVTQS